MKKVLILGGGLAGLAAAVGLAPHGLDVTIFEARGRLGGRAGSFLDASTGQMIDTCQHVGMGCCTNLKHFCKTVGIDKLIEPQKSLYFMTADGRVSRMAADPLPAPLHLARSFLSLHYLTLPEKLRIAWALLRLRAMPAEADPPFHGWLVEHCQTNRMIDRFWSLVLTSALNESIDRMGLRYARKVFVDGFFRHRRGFEVELPSVPLGRLYGEELQNWFATHGVRICLDAGVRAIDSHADRVIGVELRNGEHFAADAIVAAIPFDRLAAVLPESMAQAHECFRDLSKLDTSPITSVHVWYDRAIMALPHVVLVDCLGQWVFDRGPNASGEHYVQVVVSASRALKELGHTEVERRIVAELAEVLPRARNAEVRRVRVITEHDATFSAVPGVDQWRPGQQTPIANLYLAGDWTRTGWPATMESAVRSGYLAAEALLRDKGTSATLLQPDL